MTGQTFPCGRLNAVLWCSPGSRPSGSSKRLFKSAYVRTFLPLLRPIPDHLISERRSSPAYQPVGYPFLTQDDFAYPAFPAIQGMIHTSHAAVIHGRGGCPLSGRSAPSMDIISPAVIHASHLAVVHFLPYRCPIPPYPYLPWSSRGRGIGGRTAARNPSLVASVPQSVTGPCPWIVPKMVWASP